MVSVVAHCRLCVSAMETITLNAKAVQARYTRHEDAVPPPTAVFAPRPCASTVRGNGDSMTLYEISLRCYGDPTVFPLRACQNAEPRRVL